MNGIVGGCCEANVIFLLIGVAAAEFVPMPVAVPAPLSLLSLIPLPP